MLTRDDIERLQAFDAGGALVLSAYLDLEPARQVRGSYRAAFADLVKGLHEPAHKRARMELLRETARIETWLEGQKPRGKGLIVFSCTARELWQTHFVHVRVTDHLAYDAKPDVAPLLALIDENERYAVALVDKRDARLYSMFLGEIEESSAFRDFVAPKHDQGGWSQGNFQRHHEEHVYRHLKHVAQRLAEFLRSRPFDRLILAGPEEATNELRRLLPRALASRLVASIPADLSASTADIVEKTVEIERRVEREVEQRLIAELFDAAGGTARAVHGVLPTLDALWRGAVQTLVVAHGVQAGGGECASCKRLEPGDGTKCSACGAAMQPVRDLFHRAMAHALEQAGSVEVVHADAAQRLLAAGGGLGALLRYRWPMEGEKHGG